MHLKAFTVLAIALAGALGAPAQTTQVFTAAKSNEYALVYTLPMTRVEVTLQATRTRLTPGPLAAWAKQLLHIDPILEKSDTWQLTGAEITPLAVADTDNRWQVQFRSGAGVTMGLSDEGFPLWVNMPEGFRNPEASTAPTLKGYDAEPSILDSPAAKQATTEEMLRSTSTAQRARLAAARIFEIRQQRADLISGQADNMPSDGAALKLALQNLDMQEQALTAMFAGTTETSAEVASFIADVPVEEDEPTTFVIARLSPTAGLLPADDLRGRPVSISFDDIITADIPLNDKGLPKTFPKGGLAYRIPGEATVAISFDRRQMASLTMPVTQYGAVFGIDPALFADKKERSTAIFSPLTGAILTLGVDRTEK